MAARPKRRSITAKRNSRVRRVSRVEWRDCLKDIFVRGHNEPLTVSRSACVTANDAVLIDSAAVSVRCKNGLAQILPIYIGVEQLHVGQLILDFVFKEITDAEEYSAYQSLSEFHYRDRSLHGRRARLVIRNFHPLYPNVVGYVELTTPFYMNKPRALLLDSTFRSNGVKWSRWDIPTTRKYINLIVRIGRCVVYPEFRGLGLGQLLLKHAAIFARERWQVAGLKPLFLEISADMLKYVPFAARAGMTFIGDTQGNLDRVAKDMAYLLKNRSRVKNRVIVREEACGIVDQQVARMDRAAVLMKRQHWKLSELKRRLSRLSTVSVLRDFDLFREIVSLPKPTYLQGLTSTAEQFLHERAAAISPKNGNAPTRIQLEPLAGPIILRNLCLKFDSRIRRTRETHSIQQAFAISPDEFSHTIIKALSLDIQPGEVVLITGSSGSGKTTLLRQFLQRRPDSADYVSRPVNYKPGAFTPITSRKSLIEVLAHHDVKRALDLMGTVGLSDAFVYLKRFRELSNGQQYRAMLARLITGGHNVWLADEFCANLDVLTANVVADRLQRLARKLRAVLIVASSQPESFLQALNPDQVVQLTTAWQHRVVKGAEFLNEINRTPQRIECPSLPISPEYVDAIRHRKKHTTIRKGRAAVQTGLLLLKSNTFIQAVNVTDVRHTRYGLLTSADARNDGFSTLTSLRRALSRHYPNLRDRSDVTIVKFETLCQPGAANLAQTNGLDADSRAIHVTARMH